MGKRSTDSKYGPIIRRLWLSGNGQKKMMSGWAYSHIEPVKGTRREGNIALFWILSNPVCQFCRNPPSCSSVAIPLVSRPDILMDKRDPPAFSPSFQSPAMPRFLFFALLLAAAPVSGQGLTVSHIAGSIHMINGQGGNIGVSVGADGFLMVDDKFAPLADQIRALLKDLGEGDLEFLLNTHFHGDHTGGNAEFGAETPIIAHHNVRARLTTEQQRGDRITPPAPPVAWPVITFAEALSIHFNGEEVRVLHVPHAHTDGDALIFFTGSNVIHMGDTFFNQRFPFVDMDSGGAVDGVLAAGRAVLAQANPETRIIPGHGPVASPSDLETYLRMIEETRAAVAAGIDAGHSLEELQAVGAGDEWATWGDGFISTDRWIATLHRDLTE